MDKVKVLSGRYELLEQIGSGGFGSVFRSKDRKTGRIVAVKALHAHLASEEAYLRRLHREVIIAKALSSDHAVKVLASGNDGGIAYLVMEYVDGMTLRDVLKRDGALTATDALEVALQTAEALRDAHGKGIVHRDVKPPNIFITPGGVKLGDFGIARADDVVPLTMHTGYLGTVAYGSPEQVRGEDPDARSDIYSLGVVLYEMLSGRPPFRGSPLAIMDAHLNQAPEPIQDVPAPLNAVLLRCLAKARADRFQTTDALCQAMRGLLEPGTDGTLVVEQATVVQAPGRGRRDEHPPSMKASVSAHRRIPWFGRGGAPPGGSPPAGAPSGDGKSDRDYLFWVTTLSLASTGLVAGIVVGVLLLGGDTPDDGEPTPTITAAESTTVAFSRIAYVDQDDGNVWLIDPDKPLAGERIVDTDGAQQPAWSPDGRKLAWVDWHGGPGGIPSGILVWDPDATNGPLVRTVLGPVDYVIEDLVWTPDGQSILYHRQDGDDTTSSILVHTLSEPDDSGDQLVLSAASLSNHQFVRPSIAGFDLVYPGDRLVVQACSDFPLSGDGVRGCGVYLMPLSDPTSDIHTVVEAAPNEYYGFPASSPDGQTVAIQTYPGDKAFIEVVTLATMERRVLAEAYPKDIKVAPYWPKIAWSPDSEQIVFESYYDTKAGDKDRLFRIAVQGGTPEELGVPGRHPAWAYSGGASP